MSAPPGATAELDMGFPAEEVMEGIARLLDRLGSGSARIPSPNGARFRTPQGVTVDVAPMPEERIQYPILVPRTLLRLRGEPAAVESLRREILLAFLRGGG